jgi:hypothetical protein
MSIFGASANDIPRQKRQTKTQTLPNQTNFAGCDIAPATRKTGRREHAETDLEEIQTF